MGTLPRATLWGPSLPSVLYGALASGVLILQKVSFMGTLCSINKIGTVIPLFFFFLLISPLVILLSTVFIEK